MIVRRFRAADAPTVTALGDLLRIGDPADPAVPVPLPPSNRPSGFRDLADVPGHFLDPDAGGDRYREVGREASPYGEWTTVYYVKAL